MMVYPSVSACASARRFFRLSSTSPSASAWFASSRIARDGADYWSKYLGERVQYTVPNEFLLFIEREDSAAKIISENGVIGWIWVLDWMKLKKVDFTK